MASFEVKEEDEQLKIRGKRPKRMYESVMGEVINEARKCFEE